MNLKSSIILEEVVGISSLFSRIWWFELLLWELSRLWTTQVFHL